MSTAPRLEVVEREADPEPLAAVLDAVEEHIASYIECAPQERAAIALWSAYTHVIPLRAAPPFDVCPYLFITSAERQSGKTTLLDVLRPVAARGRFLSGTSPAALLRLLDLRPTLLLDEVDTVFRPAAADATTEALRGILNSGFRITGTYERHDVTTRKTESFKTFGPKALAGIGKNIPESVYDRCIVINLRRRMTSGERRVKRARLSRLEAEGAALAERLTVSVAGIALRAFADDEFPPELSDRAADIWEPLLAVGEATGPRWAARALEAALYVSQGSTDDNLSEGQQLLHDLAEVFADAMRASDFISTSDAIGVPDDVHHVGMAPTGLCAIEDGPWASYGRTGRPITPHRVWALLRPYDIPKVKVGQQRGMRPTSFADAFARYLPKGDPTG